jgi:hypothetical protein
VTEKWAYLVAHYEQGTFFWTGEPTYQMAYRDDLSEGLNTLGEAGWDLVTSYSEAESSVPGRTTFVFKKPLEG